MFRPMMKDPYGYQKQSDSQSPKNKINNDLFSVAQNKVRDFDLGSQESQNSQASISERI
jgi:hypothetical protein